MTDRPILFSGPMVNALLAGRKTQTRLLIDNPAYRGNIRFEHAPGQRLWVREAWADIKADPHCDLHRTGAKLAYRATDDCEFTIPPRWRSPIHMPRWASRLTLIVTAVRVQRVQDITPTDAMAEGVDGIGPNNDVVPRDGWRMTFAALWNSLHGPGSWNRNDWVAAITFTVHPCNIDQMEAK